VNGNPCDTVKRPKVRHKSPVILSYSQVARFLEESKRDYEEWHPIFMIAIHCGLRAAEIRALKWSDVDFDLRLLTVDKSFTIKGGLKLTTKSGKDRRVPINPELKSFLVSYRGSKKGNDWLVERPPEFMRDEQAKIVREVCARAGVPQCTFHQLRSAAITSWVRDGIPIGKVMKMAGHVRMETTQRYYDSSGEDLLGATDSISYSSNTVSGTRVDEE